MFAALRWAEAFLAACGNKKEEGLAVLAACAAAASRSRLGRGYLAARHLEEALRNAGGDAPGAGALAACRTAALLVRKGMARQVPAVLREALKIHDGENNILNVRVDSAFPLDEAFMEALRAKLREQTAAREVRVTPRLMPELLAGCRLFMGSDCLDASLRGQLHKMAASLHAAEGWSW